MKNLLVVIAVLVAATGVALIVAPALTVALLIGTALGLKLAAIGHWPRSKPSLELLLNR